MNDLPIRYGQDWARNGGRFGGHSGPAGQVNYRLDGLDLHTILKDGEPSIFWCSDWSRIWDLVESGTVRALDLGPATYGHVDFYISLDGLIAASA